MAQRIVYWFRNDLRLNDNEALVSAMKLAPEIIPVYVFDPRQYEKTKLGFRRTGGLRAQFLIDCVTDLRNRLREKGGDLIVRVGEPEKIIPEIAESYGAQYVYTSKEIAPEETRIESSLSKRLKIANVDIRLFWMDTLNAVSDLPFQISNLPVGVSSFIEKVKGRTAIHEPIAGPENIVLPGEYEAGVMPSLPMLGIDPKEPESTNFVPEYKGGESNALEWIKAYVVKCNQDGVDLTSKDTLTDSKLTYWLSTGCFSARSLYHIFSNQIVDESVKNTLINNLFSRDYFHWTLLRYGPRLFKPSGIKHLFNQKWHNDSNLFEKWKKGEMEDEKVNAAIRKLTETGDLSYAERDLAAGYLVKTLEVNWTWGATYFESFLLDYDAAVNWGRWNNLAGVGPD